MKCILFLIGDLGLGGQERQLFYLLNNIDLKKFDPILIVWDFSPKDFYYKKLKGKFKIIGFDPKWNTLRKCIKVIIIAFKYSPKIIQSFSDYLNLASYFASKFSKDCIVVGCLRTLFRSVYDKGNSNFYKCLKYDLLDVLVSNNSTGLDQIKKHFPHSKIDFYHIPNCLEMEKSRPRKVYKKKKFVGITIGRFVTSKRFDLLLQLVKNIKNKGYNYKHIIIGYSEILSGNQIDSGINNWFTKDSLIRLVKKNNLENFIDILDRDDVINKLYDADFLVQTSELEGMPNVVMEAMASSLPVIAFDIGDTNSLVKNGETGYLVKQGDMENMTNSVERLLNNPELLKKFSINSILFAKKNFKISKYVSRYEQLYLSF